MISPKVSLQNSVPWMMDIRIINPIIIEWINGEIADKGHKQRDTVNSWWSILLSQLKMRETEILSFLAILNLDLYNKGM